MKLSHILINANSAKSYRITNVCRELTLESIRTLLEDLKVEKLQAVMFLHEEPNTYTKEIAAAFGLSVISTSVDSIFDGTCDGFMVQGAHEYLLPAWYWVVLAQRYVTNVDIHPDTFEELLALLNVESKEERETSYYSQRYTARQQLRVAMYGGACTDFITEKSLECWRAWKYKRQGPTSGRMLLPSENGDSEYETTCVIEYFYPTSYDDDE